MTETEKTIEECAAAVQAVVAEFMALDVAMLTDGAHDDELVEALAPLWHLGKSETFRRGFRTAGPTDEFKAFVKAAGGDVQRLMPRRGRRPYPDHDGRGGLSLPKWLEAEQEKEVAEWGEALARYAEKRGRA